MYIRGMRPFALLLLIAASYTCNNPRVSNADERLPASEDKWKKDSLEVVKEWVAAIRAQNEKKVKALFSEEAAKIPEYTSKEACRFWKRQLRELDREGFKGLWDIKSKVSEGRRVVYAFPICEKGVASEAIWLIQEKGKWRISTLFNTPPK